MVDVFTEDQLEEFRDSFNLFDKENDNRIHVKDLGTVLRSLGLHPTEAELTDLLGTIETEGTGKIEFADFCGILARVIKESDPETELTEAFKVFDKDGSGTISNAELRKIMTTYGETLTDEEVDEMIKDADTDGDGVVDYAEFVSIVVAEMR